MKKLLVILCGAAVATAVYWMGYGIGTFGEQPVSDECIMNRFISEQYGPQYYGILMEDDGDEYVEFKIYSDEHWGLQSRCSVPRTAYHE